MKFDYVLKAVKWRQQHEAANISCSGNLNRHT